SVDRKNVESLLTARVGDDAVLVALLFDQHGLGDLLEQIDDGRAAKRECLLREAHFEHLSSLGSLEIRDQKDQLHLVAEIGPCELLETRQVQKQKLFGKREILLKQPIPPEGATRKRNQRLVFSKPGLPHIFGRKMHDLFRRRREIARDDLNAVVREQLDNRMRNAAAGEEKTKRVEVELIERDVLETMELEPDRSHGIHRGNGRPQAIRRFPLGCMHA